MPEKYALTTGRGPPIFYSLAEAAVLISHCQRPTNQRRSPPNPSLMEWTPPDPRRQNGPGRKSARRVRSPLHRYGV